MRPWVKSTPGVSMEMVYEVAGTSRQGHKQYMDRQAGKRDRTSFYLGLIVKARELHPEIGLAKIYYLFNPEGIGRTAFEELGTAEGYAIESFKPNTTWIGGKGFTFPNLLKGLLINDINRVWATDITYYKIGNNYYYISMIMDLYSRRILACRVDKSLHAKFSCKLLKQALRNRNLPKDHQLIHHSDKGAQYTSNNYVKILKDNNVAISMCISVFENTHMERLNGIIKNAYLRHWEPNTFEQLRRLLKIAVHRYNECPHGRLKMTTPTNYEEQLLNIAMPDRRLQKIFTIDRPINTKNPNQLELFNYL